MTLFLHISAEEKKYLAHLPPNLKRKIRMAVDDIRDHPKKGKDLIEKLSGLKSYRVGRFRIVYRVSANAIHIIAVGPREVVYQKAALQMGKK
jgi:mRNA interferase RelE/StbE